MVSKIKYLTADLAKKIDIDLMGELGFSTDQLMELAGLSVAQSLYDCAGHKFSSAEQYKNSLNFRILTICGPGNNGGDGLVASRHLKHFGFCPDIFYPKRTDRPLYHNLVKQCELLNIPFLEEMPSASEIKAEYDIILDGIFGFSFTGELRQPFKDIIEIMEKSETCIGCIDIPSGWDVEKGNIQNVFTPDLLISLTLPKLCAKHFKGMHYLGGRFIPPVILEKYDVQIPPYTGSNQFILL